MFDGMKNMAAQMQMMQRLMKDENFRAFVSHPKIQELFKDPEFKDIAKSRDFSQIATHPKFAALMKDPELSSLLMKINPAQFKA
jgi:hypothetical protein